MKKKLTRNSPRHLSDTAWYYINRGSVDLIAEVHRDTATREYVATSHARLTRRQLEAMLAELPKQRKTG